MFIILLKLIYSDNVIFTKQEFKKIILENNQFKSSDLSTNQIVKISYPGTKVYKFINEGGNIIVVDSTVYLDRSKKYELCYDICIEERCYGTSWDIVCLVGVFMNVGLINFILFRYLIPMILEE